MKETALKIRTLPDSVLTKGTRPVKEITESHRRILVQMARLMYEVSGIGLAAPQVGIEEAMFVADAGTGLFKLMNPKIIKHDGEQAIEEGCLSVPGVGVKVKRARRITVEALDENGKSIVIEAEVLLATVFQHEIDHLNGKLIIDYAVKLDKSKLRKNL